MTYSSSGDFYERLQKHAIDMSERYKKRTLEMFVITAENKWRFPELLLSPVAANEVFQINNIHSIGRLSMKSMTEYKCCNDGEVSCIGMPLERWVRKLAFDEGKKLKRLFASLPESYKGRFRGVIYGISREMESMVHSEPLEKQEPADFYLSAIKKSPLQVSYAAEA